MSRTPEYSIEISTEYGKYIFGVYCYYKEGDISRPIAGVIDYDAEKQYYELPDDTFTQTERAYLQKILDSHKFEEGRFNKIRSRSELREEEKYEELEI